MTGGEAFLLDPDERLVNGELVDVARARDRRRGASRGPARAPCQGDRVVACGSAAGRARRARHALPPARAADDGRRPRGRGRREAERLGHGPPRRKTQLFMHTMPMAYVSIAGASGYTGQETLDRVLATPGARAGRGGLRLARRPARDRARPTAEPQRRAPRARLHHQRGGARVRGRHHLPLPAARAGSSGEAAETRGRGRSLGRASASGRGALRRVVRLLASASRATSASGSTGCPSSSTCRGG